MELHRQRCQKCGSLDVRNILARRQGDPATVYVRCSNCGELVARYQLQGYYHHGKGPESYLRSIGGDACDSGRAAMTDYSRIKEEALSGYNQALEQLREEGKEV